MQTHLGFALLLFSSLAVGAATAPSNTNERELLNAVNAGNLTRVEALLKTPVNINNAQPPWQLTPLLVAAENGTVEMVKLLVAHKADVNAQDRDGITALMKAIAQRNLPMVELLLDAGADIDARDRRGHTALTTAVLRSDPDVLKALIARGAEVDVVSAMGTTTWSIAQRMHEAAVAMPAAPTMAHAHGSDQAAHPMRSKSEALAQTEAVLKLLSAAGAKRPQQTVKNFDAMESHHH